MAALPQCAVLHCVVLYASVRILLASHVTVYFNAYPKQQHLVDKSVAVLPCDDVRL